MNKRGFTTLEAIASIFLISIVLFASVTILVDNRLMASATNDRLLAFQIAENMVDQISKNVTFDEMNTWMNGNIEIIDSQNCLSSGSPISCTIFNQLDFEDQIEIIIYPPDADDLLYEVIHFDIVIHYRDTRSITLGGMIYE
ncbi:MAG: hypothetical protein KKE16_00320 [Firmicutes bacterium]|nr:hypothetical protein [Bacillota bacterium]